MIKSNANDASFKKAKESNKINNSSSKDTTNKSTSKKASKKINYSQSQSKILKLKKTNSYNLYFLFFLFISIYTQAYQSKKIDIRKLETASEITITIKGTGNQKILSDDYSSVPNTV